VDPGDPGGAPKYDFVGLPEPPGVRSDEPGKTYRLLASRLGSLGPGSPLFYRDVAVGEVLGYDLGDGVRPITIDAFVRAPYDKFVHDSTHFFNSSGVSLTVGAEGLHLELESLQALLSGAVTFETPRFLAEAPVSDAGHTFKLYDNQTEADAAGFARNIPFVTYFTSSVSGLGRGSEVEIFGIQVGAVTDVRLVMDPLVGKMRARVAFDLQPERVFSEAQVLSQPNPEHVTKALVQAGMRAVLNSSNIVTGQKDISLQYVPGAPPATLGHEGDSLVLPSQGGGLDNITSSLSDITANAEIGGPHGERAGCADGAEAAFGYAGRCAAAGAARGCGHDAGAETAAANIGGFAAGGGACQRAAGPGRLWRQFGFPAQYGTAA
jgi:paraquat-inducible protein B